MRLTPVHVTEVEADDDLHAHHAAMSRRDARRGAAAGDRIWEPPAEVRADPAAARVALPIEAEMIAIITRPIGSGEGHRLGHERKERELIALLDTLTPVEALVVRRRLAAARPDDAMAAAFSRLVVERRTRLLAFLDDTRRRRVVAR
jgi:hypothetical protein